MNPNRTRLLEEMALEIQQTLDRRAIEQNILNPGEALVFSVRIEATNTVRRDERDTKQIPPPPTTLEVSAQMSVAYNYEKPAVASKALVAAILDRYTGSIRNSVRELLEQNHNRPTVLTNVDGLRLSREALNGRLNVQIRGKYYRFASQNLPSGNSQYKHGCELFFQLFLVEKRPKGG